LKLIRKPPADVPPWASTVVRSGAVSLKLTLSEPWAKPVKRALSAWACSERVRAQAATRWFNDK
jgi:hypothetical protein